MQTTSEKRLGLGQWVVHLEFHTESYRNFSLGGGNVDACNGPMCALVHSLGSCKFS